MDFLFFAILFAVVFVVVLSKIIPIFKNHYKVTNGVTNYDSGMRKFVYRVTCSPVDVIYKLTNPGNKEQLKFDYNSDNDIMYISDSTYRFKYRIRFRECEGYNVVMLERVCYLVKQSYIPYMLNPHIVEKLNAEIVPYDKFKF